MSPRGLFSENATQGPRPFSGRATLKIYVSKASLNVLKE